MCDNIIFLFGIFGIVRGVMILKKGEVRVQGGDELGDPDVGEAETLTGKSANIIGATYLTVGILMTLFGGIPIIGFFGALLKGFLN